MLDDCPNPAPEPKPPEEAVIGGLEMVEVAEPQPKSLVGPDDTGAGAAFGGCGLLDPHGSSRALPQPEEVVAAGAGWALGGG